MSWIATPSRTVARHPGTSPNDGSCDQTAKVAGAPTASTPPDHPYGFVFLNCRLTGDPAPWIDPTGTIPPKSAKTVHAYLGRPWRPNASVAFIHCEMDDHIKPEGWHNWGKPANETSARYAEFGNTGPGAAPAKRVPWAKQLNRDEAAKISVASVLGGQDHWRPE